VFFFQAEDGIRDFHVTGVQTCALPISPGSVPGTTSPCPKMGTGTATPAHLWARMRGSTPGSEPSGDRGIYHKLGPAGAPFLAGMMGRAVSGNSCLDPATFGRCSPVGKPAPRRAHWWAVEPCRVPAFGQSRDGGDVHETGLRLIRRRLLPRPKRGEEKEQHTVNLEPSHQHDGAEVELEPGRQGG